ncbi:hypothetical protein Patl1_00452 [Pistacia atlantica]|uniref:Uncharacterized protein n=1 Tax=Pistacia atlantica TaxID=434234 RepID=A0ACC1CCV1_9ROSI|nr:hypothetical protein Patl1_00452 [Pistacia atlantica]
MINALMYSELIFPYTLNGNKISPPPSIKFFYNTAVAANPLHSTPMMQRHKRKPSMQLQKHHVDDM